MDLLLILTYMAICIVIFKIFKLRLNKWTAVLGGIFLIGSLIVVMNYNHPYSEISREYFVTAPIVPAVTGTVIEVPVTGAQSALYTQHFSHVAIMRKILLPMSAWMNYLFPFH